MNAKSVDDLRDCVKQAFLNGSERGYEFRKMRHAIILELKRLGYDDSEIKDKLGEWNERCEKPLNISAQKNQLFKYVDWVSSKTCKLSCNALQDFCLGKETCVFSQRTLARNKSKSQKLPLDLSELEDFLEERYKADGYMMLLIVKALRFFQIEKQTGEIIFVGVRKLCSVIRDRLGHLAYPMEIHRKINLLIDEGVIKKVCKGERGNFSWKANGYQFLSWKHPRKERVTQPVTAPIFTHMCNKA